MALFLKNIHQLVTPLGKTPQYGKAMRQIHIQENVFIRIENGRITTIDTMNNFPETTAQDTVINCQDCIVLPGYVDAHTHLVFPKTREKEFLWRIQGKSYQEIAEAGGGILATAKATQQCTKEELLKNAIFWAKQLAKLGTTVIEIKSGYGLYPEAELKLLEVANELQNYIPQKVVITCLAAHALPMEYRSKREAYIERVCKELIPEVAERKLATYIDVFCEEGFFTPEESEQILQTALEYGLKTKVHANELGRSGGVQVGIRCKATSVDHLEHIAEEELQLLYEHRAQTIPVVLPGTSFFLNLKHAPARRLIDADLALALASDFNPGTAPGGNLNLIFSIACAQLGLLPEEALTALTLNAAAAIDLAHEYGSIEVGKVANLIITQPLQNFYLIPYHFGHSWIKQVIIEGEVVSLD